LFGEELSLCGRGEYRLACAHGCILPAAGEGFKENLLCWTNWETPRACHTAASEARRVPNASSKS
jgi:hypothetical protein